MEKEKDIYKVTCTFDGYGYLYDANEIDLALTCWGELLEYEPTEKEIKNAIKNTGYDIKNLLSIHVDHYVYSELEEEYKYIKTTSTYNKK